MARPALSAVAETRPPPIRFVSAAVACHRLVDSLIARAAARRMSASNRRGRSMA
jgi:hypothetical protein